MSLIEYNEILSESAERLFDFTQDYSARHLWDPFPESYRFIPPACGAELGASLEVIAKNGQSMVVRYVSYNRPRAAAIEMVSGPWFISRFHGTWSFTSLAPQRTRVVFKYNVSAKPRALAWLIQPILNRSFRWHARHRVRALHDYIAAQQSVAADRREDAAPAEQRFGVRFNGMDPPPL
jgi:ribosome-associated toxin RatA of RatAB toxin-antitoxin module